MTSHQKQTGKSLVLAHKQIMEVNQIIQSVNILNI
jgi:hypothetical protein